MGMRKKLDSPAIADDLDRPATDELDILGVLACTNTALRRAARRLGQLYDDALAPLNLKATQIGLMAEIARLSASGGETGPTLQDLAAKLAIQISALTHALRPLVRDGLVELQPDAEDRRIKHGVLTRLGKKRLSEALVYWSEANNRVEVVLGSNTAAKLRALADNVASDEFLAAYNGEDLVQNDTGHR